MSRRLRDFFAALVVAALVAGSAGPASAGALEEIDANSVPPMFDLLFLRPMGLATTVVGLVAFGPVAAFAAAFQPADARAKVAWSYDVLVRHPATFTFVDPLGSH